MRHNFYWHLNRPGGPACPFLVPVTLPATSLKISQQFPGLPLDLRVRQFASLQFPIVPKRSHYARSKWIHPAASNPLCEEANSRIPRNPRIQEPRCGFHIAEGCEAPVHVNQTPSDSHTNRTKSGIDDLWPGFHSPPCQPPISSSSPGWPPPLPAKWEAPANCMGSNESRRCSQL